MVKINSHKSKIFLCFLLTQTQHEKMFEVLLLFATVIRQTAGITSKTISLYFRITLIVSCDNTFQAVLKFWLDDVLPLIHSIACILKHLNFPHHQKGMERTEKIHTRLDFGYLNWFGLTWWLLAKILSFFCF